LLGRTHRPRPKTGFDQGNWCPVSLPAPTRHGASHHAVTALTAERVPTPVTAGRRRPTWASGLIHAPMPSGRVLRSLFTSSCAFSTHALTVPFATCFAIANHRHTLPWPSMAIETSTSTSSSVDVDREPKSTATSPATASLPAASSSMSRPPSTTTSGTSPAKPTL
jgi:hypothetical protein